MNPYIGDRELEPPESGYECKGCGQQFNGFASLGYHTRRCQKFLLLPEEEETDETVDEQSGQGTLADSF